MSDIQNMVQRFANSSKENIRQCYRNIAQCYNDLDYLHSSYNYYSNKRDIFSELRKKYANDIQQRIRDIYSDINYYRECINAEKKEIRRLYDTYGYEPHIVNESDEDEYPYEEDDEELEDLDSISIL
jgi:hypothetical protein